MTCEPPSPPATLLPSPHPPETIFESVAPTEPCRHLHPRRWETMGARLPSPAPDRPHRPRVSLKAVPSALGVCHLWGGVGGSWGCSFPHPPKRGCCCECGFALVVVALLCRGGRVGGGPRRGCSIPLPATLVGAGIPAGDGQQGTASFFLRCSAPRCRLSNCFARAEIRRMGTRRRLRTWGWMEKPRSARRRYPFGKIRVSSPGITSCLGSARFPAHRHLSLTQRPVKTQSVEIRTQKLCESSASVILRQPQILHPSCSCPLRFSKVPVAASGPGTVRLLDAVGQDPLLPSQPMGARPCVCHRDGAGDRHPSGFLISC